jgi:hypothetical protein
MYSSIIEQKKSQTISIRIGATVSIKLHLANTGKGPDLNCEL